ncbi:cellulose synthase [Trinickia terrae]|uniref:Cellulose synthase n=1 Tax=Trinickia terrae TaxID=2571161 RepID=A0A4U1HUM7_9BURK|nr:cellulose synthase [Trinickia terrae]TKC83787.1 cellulose synthase [Trinickia terrae]
MNKQKLSILQVIKRSGVSKRTGNPWEIHAAQCVLEQDVEGEKQILVGTINMPNHLKDVLAGDYLAEFAFAQSIEGKLEPRIVSLQPFGMPSAKPKPGAGVGASA